MPQFIVGCTESIRGEARLPELSASVNTAPAATEISSLGGIRNWVHWVDTRQVVDGKHDYTFVHMTLKIGSGHSPEGHQEMGEMLFDLIETHFTSLMESRYLTLSFEITELHPTPNLRQNSVHALFK